jgi:tRNA dimethylallyltransferase
MASPLIAILGPTAVGKTALSLHLARVFVGEVVSADSRQIYRGLNIGTAKVTPQEQAIVPHHLIDVAAPDEPLTLAEYQHLAYAAIDSIHSRGRLPLLVGGSGLYVRTVLEGWSIPQVPPKPDLRAALERIAQRRGDRELHRWLKGLDPAAARRIDARNLRRVIRALEVTLTSGRPISQLQARRPPSYRTLRVGLTMPRAELYRRIDQRVDAMMGSGLLEEVRSLVQKGFSLDLPAMSGLGYRQMGGVLRAEITLADAVAQTKKDTRRFVRQQYSWFQLDDARIHWFDASSSEHSLEVEALVRRFLGEESQADPT